MDTERLLEWLAMADAERTSVRAPARLKARIYSGLIKRLSETGRLLSLTATKASGAGLCVFEDTMASLPVGEQIKSMNLCRVCHARLLAERLERATTFWPHCPYADFHRRPTE